MEHYDIAIIGGGQAGVPLAYELPRAGKRIVLIERKPRRASRRRPGAAAAQRTGENATQYIIKGAVLVAAVGFDMAGRRKS